MTITVNMGLPVGDKEASVQLTMPVTDAVALVAELGELAKEGSILAALKDAVSTHLNL